MELGSPAQTLKRKNSTQKFSINRSKNLIEKLIDGSHQHRRISVHKKTEIRR